MPLSDCLIVMLKLLFNRHRTRRRKQERNRRSLYCVFFFCLFACFVFVKDVNRYTNNCLRKAIHHPAVICTWRSTHGEEIVMRAFVTARATKCSQRGRLCCIRKENLLKNWFGVFNFKVIRCISIMEVIMSDEVRRCI